MELQDIESSRIEDSNISTANQNPNNSFNMSNLSSQNIETSLNISREVQDMQKVGFQLVFIISCDRKFTINKTSRAYTLSSRSRLSGGSTGRK